jgi:hypothetical protein
VRQEVEIEAVEVVAEVLAAAEAVVVDSEVVSNRVLPHP